MDKIFTLTGNNYLLKKDKDGNWTFTEINGSFVKKIEKQVDNVLFVENIPYEISLIDFFKQFGFIVDYVASVNGHNNKDGAYIKLRSGVDEAISSLNGIEYNGNIISVSKSEWPVDRVRVLLE